MNGWVVWFQLASAEGLRVPLIPQDLNLSHFRWKRWTRREKNALTSMKGYLILVLSWTELWEVTSRAGGHLVGSDTHVELVSIHGKFCFTSCFLALALSPCLTFYENAGFIMDFPGGTRGKESAYQCRRHKRRRRHEFDPCIGKIPWSRKWQPFPVNSWLKNSMDRRVRWATVHGSQRVGRSWECTHAVCAL